MNIKNIEIKNILSIETLNLDFANSGLVLLDGWNYDDDTANGAGKTAVFNALSFGLYDEVPRKISKTEILRDGVKTGYVKVSLEVDGVPLEVVRTRPNGVKFYENGVEKIMTQQEFEGKIKINYSQYLISMYSAQTQGQKLISMNDTGKKDFFLQLMNLEKMGNGKKEADLKLKDIAKSMLEQQSLETELKSRIAAYQESIVDVAELADEIKKLDIAPLIAKLKKLQDIQKPDVSKFDTLEKGLNDYLNKLTEMQVELKHKRQKHAELKREIELLLNEDLHDTLSCPSCSAEIIVSSTGAKTIESVRAEHLAKIKGKKDALLSLVEDINSYPAIEDEKAKAKEKIEKCRTKKAQEFESYNDALETIAELRSKIKIRENTIKEHQAAIDKNEELKSKVQKAKDKLETISSRLDELDQQRLLYEAVSSMFGPSGAPAYIMDTTVEMFNEYIANHVNMIWPNATYSLQSFKENKSGEIRAKFSEKLIINGKEKSTGSLSGGEYRCLSIALDFAVIDVLENMFGISLNPIIMDEPFNDLDASNRERVIELLEKLAVKRQIWIIDHASEAKAMFSNVARIEKRGGISKLV